MQTIHITVRKKFAVCTDIEAMVANNTDWQIEFDLDEEWDDGSVRFCRFYYNDYQYDKDFTGNICQAPSYHDYKINDGPEPYFIGVALFTFDAAFNRSNIPTNNGDPLLTNVCYIKCVPSLQELGDPGLYTDSLTNLLYMTTSSSDYPGLAWATSSSAGSTIKINTPKIGKVNSIINDVCINFTTKDLITINVPFKILNSQGNPSPMEWGKDYVFSYILDYAYNCAYWWTYEIGGQVYWKSPVKSVLSSEERMQSQVSGNICLPPTNLPEHNNDKCFKLYIKGSFGSDLMNGGKIRFLNVKVMSWTDKEELKSKPFYKDNYIRTKKTSTSLHAWNGTTNLTFVSAGANESEWVLLKEYKSKSASSSFNHIICASKGNSLFPQNGLQGNDWKLTGVVFNTSPNSSVNLLVYGIGDDNKEYRLTEEPWICQPKTSRGINLSLLLTTPYLNNQPVQTSPKSYKRIELRFSGGNNGNNTIIVDNLRLFQKSKLGYSPIESIENGSFTNAAITAAEKSRGSVASASSR